MSEFSELVFGYKNSKDLEKFEDGLDEIQNKYKSYFEHKNNSGFIDGISNHYILIISNGTIKFIFNKDSNLDLEIKNECIQLFESIFNKK